ncbi:MAG: 5'-deoxynucleotidase [Clostridia bacterium]|nr:5'-deoxynucleotidase [Clostridia bacterium]MBQ3898070.1 5'-deoxynucleotidase [Clostridia bacterium]
MQNDFYAFVSRMKYIDRWALMRNTEEESLTQHSYEVAVVAHALAVISNKRLGTDYDPGKIALIALFHDASEILTGDMPTPVKYFSPDITHAYKDVEKIATLKLLEMLPEDLRSEYEDILLPKPEDAELWKLNKAADKISALIKCIEEQKAGNREFDKAREATEAAIHGLNCEAAEIFLREFLPSFNLTLDQLNK